ncbi:hypothetical protein diail_8443 [Diaporthe ilicicola]|nr:hypothetical protein diail_8443 [Diaporthe ilicicola]
MISTTIATELNLPSDTFTSLQDPQQASGTILRLIKVFSTAESLDDCRTSMIHHTDFGTITLLANVLGGLQILAPGRPPSDTSAWLWVKPHSGCLVVVPQQIINVEQNLGDAMVQWTGGLLRSNLHRIRYAPGAQSSKDRLSLALLVRPERNASMRRLISGNDGDDKEQEEDSQLTAWEWEVKKTMALKRGDACAESKGGAHVNEA